MPEKRETTGWAIVGVTVLIAALAGATTYAHRATFNVIDNAGIIIEWIVVAFVAVGVVGTAWRRRRMSASWAGTEPSYSDNSSPVIDAVAVDDTEPPFSPEDRPAPAPRPDARRAG